MAIAIRRIGNLYEAEVSPPHSRSGSWATPRPMTVDALVRELERRGCHQTDIGDAFYAADPNWLSNDASEL